MDKEKERTSPSAAFSIIYLEYVFPAEQDHRCYFELMLTSRLKTLIKNPKGDFCCHECDLEPREQVKRPRSELKTSCFQKCSNKSSLAEKHH